MRGRCVVDAWSMRSRCVSMRGRCVVVALSIRSSRGRVLGRVARCARLNHALSAFIWCPLRSLQPLDRTFNAFLSFASCPPCSRPSISTRATPYNSVRPSVRRRVITRLPSPILSFISSLHSFIQFIHSLFMLALRPSTFDDPQSTVHSPQSTVHSPQSGRSMIDDRWSMIDDR